MQIESESVKTLIISNGVLLGFFIVQKIIDLILGSLRKNEEKKDNEFDRLKDKVHKLEIEMAGFKSIFDQFRDLQHDVRSLLNKMNRKHSERATREGSQE